MSDDEMTYPLNSKEAGDVEAKAAAAGEAAQLAWAKDNAPITPDQVRSQAYAVALWLLTISGKIGSRTVSFEQLYKDQFTSRATDVHYIGFYPRGVKGSFDQISAFNRIEVDRIDESVEGLAIIVAQILCTRSNLDEVHEISQADWGIQLPGGEYFVVAKSTWGRWKQRAAVLKKRTPSNVFLIECMRVLGFDAGLDGAYSKGYPELEPGEERGRGEGLPGYDEIHNRLTNRILKDRDRKKRLEKQGARKETFKNALAHAAKLKKLPGVNKLF